MTHRSFASLAVSMCLAACVTETTSLGGPRGTQSSASSGADAGADSGPPTSDDWSPPAYSSTDGGPPGAWPCGYSWMPVPAAGPCEYVLPERQNDSQDLDPATWDPHNVRVDLWTLAPTSDPNVWTMVSREIGGHKERADACGTEHGWYYVSSEDGGGPTSYALCPTSCDFLGNEGADFRLQAFGWCGPR